MSGAKGRGRSAVKGKDEAGGGKKRPPARKTAVKKAAPQPPSAQHTTHRSMRHSRYCLEIARQGLESASCSLRHCR